MASIKDLKKRIGTVKNTQQTTRAMKMVSAAKLRRGQDAIQNQRPFAHQMSHLIRNLSSVASIEGKSPFIAAEPRQGSDGRKRVLLVVVTSDRGLCGGFNSAVIKATQKWLQSQAWENRSQSVELAFVGKKGHDFFKTRDVKINAFYPELGGKVSFVKAKKLAQTLCHRYLEGEVDEVKFIYNEFKNAVTQKVMVEDFLPIQMKAEEEVKKSGIENSSSRAYIIKPSPRELLDELMAKNFSVQAFRIMLESQAGEHGARMSAMENATKNAGEMIRRLTLQYNKQRQAGITKELLEIISGSESQKG